MTTTTLGTNQTEILRRILEHQRDAMTPEVAHYFLQLDLPDSDRMRLDELAVKAGQGTLSANELADLDEFRRLGHLVEMMKIKARKALGAQ